MMWLTYAMLAAVGFGIRGILYHWTSQKPVNRNLLLCGVFFMGALVNVTLAIIYQSDWTLACLVGIQMGIFSFGASASMFKGFAVGKASLVAILTALPSVVVVLAAFLFWGERLHMMQMLAFLIITGGILLVRYSNDLSLKNLQGAQWGLLAMLCFAFNDLSGKWSTILEASLFPTSFFMFIVGTMCFGLWYLIDVKRARAQEQFLAFSESATAIYERTSESATDETIHAYSVNTPEGSHTTSPVRQNWSVSRTFLVGMAVGTTNTVGMILILTAFGIGKAGLVSAVVALNVPIVLLYTRFVLKENFSKTELTGIFLSVIGIVLMKLFGA